MKISTFAFAAVCLTTFSFPLSQVAASQLDWDAHTDATFTSANGYSSNIIVDGMMVNVTIGGSTANLIAGYPVVNAANTGGTAGPENSLALGANFADTSQSFSVTVTFRTLGGALLPVMGVNFDLFDVDRGGTTGTANTYTWVDRISGIQATLNAGAPINPTNVTGTAGGNTVLNSVVTGAGTVVNSGAGSNGANAFISFGSQTLTSFSFIYGSAATPEGVNNQSVAQTDPATQIIALHDINFVPEPGTNALIAASSFAAGFLFLRRQIRS